MQLVVEGQVLEYRKNQAAQDMPMQWPGEGGATQLVLESKRRNAENARAYEGRGRCSGCSMLPKCVAPKWPIDCG